MSRLRLWFAMPADARTSDRRPRARRTLVIGLLALAMLAGSAAFTTQNVSAAPITYYVDCSAGNDADAGTSTGAAWQTLPKANAAIIAPGGALLLKRGCTWNGTLNAKWNGTAALPITVGAYGSGALPKIQNGHEDVMITGTYQIIREIHTRSDAVGTDPGCQNRRTGWRAGFRFMSGAAYNTVRDSVANEHYIGIFLDAGSHHNKVLNNTLQNNNMADPNTSSDAGAVGISLAGDDNEVAYNTISGSEVCSRFYVRDGAAIEVYMGRRNVIHHNRAIDNQTFTELGHSRSADNTYAYNVVTSSLPIANFLVTRGPNNGYGPVYGTKVYNSSVYLSGSQSYAIQCTGGCSPSVLSFKNNIVWAEDRVGYADANFDEGHNVYWKSNGAPLVYFNIAGTSRKADPRYVNRGGGDLRIGSGSPAIDLGNAVVLSAGFTTDFANAPIPQGAAVDSGAYETAGAAGPATYVVDSFERNVGSGWGSAQTGGSYTIIGTAAEFSVSGGVGSMITPRANSRAVTLNAVSARDVDSTFRVRVDKAGTGSGNYAYFVARSVASLGTEYRLKVRFSSSGVFVHGTRVVGNVEADVGGEGATGLNPAPGTFIRVHAQVVGTSPTTLRIRVWADGAAEPGTWHYSGTDATAGLAGSGAVGLRAYVSSSSTNASVTVGFDDWRVTAP